MSSQKIEAKLAGQRQVRAFTNRIKVRKKGDDTQTLSGYGLQWKEEADIGGWFRERFEPGAFLDSIRDGGQKMLASHSGLPLGSRSGNTLTLGEDDNGLTFDVDMDMTQGRSADIVRAVKRGDLDGISIGFRMVKYRIEYDHDQEVDMLIVQEKVDLWELSFVSFPAFSSSEVGARMLRDVVSDHRGQQQMRALTERNESEAIARAAVLRGSLLRAQIRQADTEN